MIETQVMVTPKRKSVDVNRMHLEYKWELPINHGICIFILKISSYHGILPISYLTLLDLEAIGMRLDATEREGRSAFFILRDEQRPAKVAFLCKTGAAKKRVSLCIPTEQGLKSIEFQHFFNTFIDIIFCVSRFCKITRW